MALDPLLGAIFSVGKCVDFGNSTTKTLYFTNKI